MKINLSKHHFNHECRGFRTTDEFALKKYAFKITVEICSKKHAEEVTVQFPVYMSGSKKKFFKEMAELENKHVTFTIKIVRLDHGKP